METMALWMGIGILYCLFQFLHDAPKSRTYYMTAVGLYFGVCFVHERYMVLLPVLLLGLVFGRWAGAGEKRSREWSAGSPEEEEVRRDAGRSRSRASRSGARCV